MIPESYALERVDVSALSGFAGNPRTHSDARSNRSPPASASSAGPIRSWSMPRARSSPGMAGLQRQSNWGLPQVPVIRLGHLSDAQRKALVIADNQLALNAGWDEAALSVLIQELDAEKFELDLLGFAADDLDRYLAGLDGDAASGGGGGRSPEVPVDATSQPGDLWILGDHRVLCGDATVLTDVETPDGRPAGRHGFYAIRPTTSTTATRAKDKMRGKDRRILNDALGEGFYQFLYDACVNMLTVTKGACYICMSSSELHTLQKAFPEAGGKWSTFVIWAKNTFTLGRADYQRQYEPILYGWKEGTDHYWCGARDQGDVWFVDKPRVNDLHPTMKPVELVERAIRNSSQEPRHRPRSLRRLRHDADRCRAHRPVGAACWNSIRSTSMSSSSAGRTSQAELRFSTATTGPTGPEMYRLR